MGRRVKLSRREFLQLSAFTASGATLAACNKLDTSQYVRLPAPGLRKFLFNAAPDSLPGANVNLLLIPSNLPTVILEEVPVSGEANNLTQFASAANPPS